MRASQTSCNKDATRMMERQAQRERERERENGGGGAGRGHGGVFKTSATHKLHKTKP